MLAFPGTCYLQPQLHGTGRSTSSVRWSTHAHALFSNNPLTDPAVGEGLTRCNHGFLTTLATRKKKPMKFCENGSATLMCHANSVNWAHGGTSFCCFLPTSRVSAGGYCGLCSSFPIISPMVMWVLCQHCCCRLEVNNWASLWLEWTTVVVLIKLNDITMLQFCICLSVFGQSAATNCSVQKNHRYT